MQAYKINYWKGDQAKSIHGNYGFCNNVALGKNFMYQ